MQRLDSVHHSSIIFRASRRMAVLTAFVFVVVASALAADGPQVYTDKTAYNVGQEVRVVNPSTPGQEGTSNYRVTLRYLGSSKPILDGVPLPAARGVGGYHRLWKIPSDAQTGRYEIELVRPSDQTPQGETPERLTSSFSVYRKLVEVDAPGGAP